MANPLTGDHDAVLQVSVGTLNRLLASMHQNEGTDAADYLPTIPHSAFVRVGDDPATRVDGVQGVARVQAGVPRLELVHLAQDRVVGHIWLRARFTASSGSAPFREFIHGTLRAEYTLKEIPGVGVPGGIVFVPPSVRFDLDPTNVTFRSAGDTSHDAAIARQVAALLRTTFAMPGGHPMLVPLVDRKLISLSAPDGSQAVAVGFELGPAPVATERPRQIANVITGGKDFALAVSRDFILGQLRPQLDALLATTTSVEVSALFVHVTYTVKITSATANWGVDAISAGGTTTSCGALDLTIQGKGTTTSIAPNFTFTITHRILLAFNPSAHALFLTPKGGPDVSVHLGGIGPAEDVIAGKIESTYNAQIAGVLAAALPQLALMSGFSDFVAEQLKMSDDHAQATLDAAEFTVDGFVLRGTASLTPRTQPVVQFGPLHDASGYGGFLSWFPGGRITNFHWEWVPAGLFLVVLPPQHRDHADRFVVQPGVEMPGLPRPSDGQINGGSVCLSLEGLVIDPVTGAEVPASASACLSVDAPPPEFLRDIVDAPLRWGLGEGQEMGVVEAGHSVPGAEPCNTLLYHVGLSSEPPSLDAVLQGVDGAERDDAGLLLLTLIRERGVDEAAAARLSRSAPKRGAAARVVEDVAAEWARAFHVSANEALRLVTADGRLAWSHDGPIDAEALSAALREHLVPSASPQFLPLRPGAGVGRKAPNISLDPSPDERLALVQLRGRPVTLCFTLVGSDSSLEQIRRLKGAADREQGFVAVVLTDADAMEAASFAGTHAPHLVVTPDPHRRITDAFGVFVWPTTITINEAGIVACVTSGLHPEYEQAPSST